MGPGFVGCDSGSARTHWAALRVLSAVGGRGWRLHGHHSPSFSAGGGGGGGG